MDPYLEPKGRERERQRARQGPPGRGHPVFALLRALVILLFGILIVQLVRLQVVKGDDYARQSEINALREVQMPPARGLILDREGRPLVTNAARFSAAVVPGHLPDRGEGGVYREPVTIKADIDGDTALMLRELEPVTPGLELQVEPTRRYLEGPLLAHVLGYVGSISQDEYEELRNQGYVLQDYIGKTGIELTYESVLRGRPGKKLIEVDALGRELRVISERRALDGANPVLTIDLDLQRKAKETLEEFTTDGDNAAAVVMDIDTGEILAMVSLPGFDNNVFSGPLSDEELAALVEGPGKPLLNHAIAERYAPGSTFKTIVGAAALAEGIASTGTTLVSRGYTTG